jgi:hypothetical protein
LILPILSRWRGADMAACGSVEPVVQAIVFIAGRVANECVSRHAAKINDEMWLTTIVESTGYCRK